MNQLDTLPQFELPGTDDQLHSTADYDDKTAVVIIFTCNHCPYARAYISRINNIVATYAPKRVGFYAISANDVVKYPEDSFDNMKPMASLLNLEGKYLYDESQEIAKMFGAQRTPEVYVFNQAKELVYQGALDDNYQNEEEVSQHYLIDALDATLEDKAPPISHADAVGCSIKWK